MHLTTVRYARRAMAFAVGAFALGALAGCGSSTASDGPARMSVLLTDAPGDRGAAVNRADHHCDRDRAGLPERRQKAIDVGCEGCVCHARASQQIWAHRDSGRRRGRWVAREHH